MQRWFYFYNSGPNSLTQSLIISPKNFPVCKEINDKKRFSVFRNAYELYNHIIFSEKSTRCMYEIIRSDVPQKPYFDIDIDLENNNNFLSKEDKIEIAELLPGVLIDAIIKIRPEISYRDIMIFNSHSDSKRSYHVVVDRWLFSDCRQNFMFFKDVLSQIPSLWQGFLDSSMYKVNQQFRLYMCTKYGKNRHKRLDFQKSKWIVENDVENDQLNERIFYASLVTKSEGCSYLEPYVEEENYSSGANIIEDEHYKKIELLLKKMKDWDCFRISEYQDCRIILKRLLPSKCEECSKKDGYDRIHESENPYVKISKSGNVYFDCRRGSSKIIGNVNDEVYEEIKVRPIEITQEIKEEKNNVETKEENTIEQKPVLSIPEKKTLEYREIDNTDLFSESQEKKSEIAIKREEIKKNLILKNSCEFLF